MNPQIMIIDDDEDFNLLFKKQLEKNDFEIDCYVDPNEFLRELKNKNPNVCVIDLNLDKNHGAGFQILQAIRNKLGVDLPLFVMSRRSSKADISLAFELGATEYIQKPFDEAIFLSKVLPYVSSKVQFTELPFFKIPRFETSCEVELDFSISKITEFGLEFTSHHYFSKGIQLTIENEFLSKILGFQGPINVEVTGSDIDEESRMYKVEVEFEELNKDHLAKLRHWLARN